MSRDHASSCCVGNDFRSHSPFRFASGGHQILILKVYFCQLKIKSMWHFTGNVDAIWKELSQELLRGNTHCSCMMHTPTVSQLCPSDWHLKGSHSISDELSADQLVVPEVSLLFTVKTWPWVLEPFSDGSYICMSICKIYIQKTVWSHRFLQVEIKYQLYEKVYQITKKKMIVNWCDSSFDLYGAYNCISLTLRVRAKLNKAATLCRPPVKLPLMISS